MINNESIQHRFLSSLPGVASSEPEVSCDAAAPAEVSYPGRSSQARLRLAPPSYVGRHATPTLLRLVPGTHFWERTICDVNYVGQIRAIQHEMHR